jgi:hypothetical protein
MLTLGILSKPCHQNMMKMMKQMQGMDPSEMMKMMGGGFPGMMPGM